MLQDTRKPTGKMDFDTEDRLLPANHYRYAKNGRSGTSDRDGEGAVENIRGNVLRGTSTFNRGTVIGSCPDVKNNAVIFFRKKAGDIAVTYTSATRISGTQIEVVGPSVGLSLGEEIRVEQTSNTFNAVIVSRLADVYTISLKSGTFPAQSIVSINIVTNNVIVRYFEDTQIFQFLTNPGLMGDVLNFTGKIYNPRVIESSFGQLLTWVQYPDGEPCLMNIDRMKVGAEYFNIASDDQYIALAKQPPIEAPELTYYYDSSAINYLSENGYQFRYRYIFDDNQSSVYSPISVISITAEPYSNIGVRVNSGHKTVTRVELLVRNGIGVSGSQNNEWYVFESINKIESSWLDNTFYEVKFYGNELLKIVSRIETDKLFEAIPITASALEVTDENQIVLADLTEGYDNVDMAVVVNLAYRDTGIYDFNIVTNIAIDSYLSGTFSAGNTLYLRVNTGAGVYDDCYYEIQSSDLLTYPDALGAKIVEILANIGAVYTYNSGTNQLTRSSGNTLVQLTVFKAPSLSIYNETNDAYSGALLTVLETVFSSNFSYYCNITFTGTLRFLTAPGNMQVIYDVGATTIVDNIAITTTFQSYTFNKQIKAQNGDIIRVRLTSAALDTIEVQADSISKVTGNFLYLEKGFKYGSTVDLGIVYYDEYLRSTFVQKIGTTSIDSLPSNINVAQFSTSSPLVGYIPCLDWEVKNVPPVWAKYYQFVVKECSISEFSYFTISSTTYNPVTIGTTDTIEISYLDTPNYTPQIGDLICYLGDTTNGDTRKYLFNKVSNQSYYEVLDVDVSTKTITVSSEIAIFAPGFPLTPFINERSIFEIRRKAPVNSEFYFEFDNMYPIGDAGTANRYHVGETQNQDPLDPFLTPAKGRITNGQIWYRFHNDTELTWSKDNQRVYYVESYYPLDNSSIIVWDRGRPNIASDFAKQVSLPTSLRWGGKLINQTLVNNLSTWDEGNINSIINTKFGSIVGLRQIGYTLKIVQWANINSVFIGRRELQNADNSTNLAVTDNLIGTINPSEREFGTKYPGSIISTGQRLYYFDSLKSKYIVDDGNGVNEIALYGGPDGGANSTMSKYFRQLANTINASSNYDIITGFDYLYRDMYVTITNRTLNTQETLYYNETQNAWKYFVDMEHLNLAGNVKYIPDFYGNVGQSFFAFMLGNTFQFNKAESGGEPLYSQLFKFNNDDPLKKLVVETVGMIEPDKVKVFLTHALHANLSPELVEITVPPNQMYPNGMYTRLKPGNYKYREGVFYADIKRDAYTKGFTTDETIIKNLIANGRPMRGHVCVVRLTFSTSDYCKLFTTSIGMIPSELS